MSVKVCDACGVSMSIVGKRDWLSHKCTAAGLDACDATHPVCPTHGTLVWTVGPYSTYRVCGLHWGCNAGKNGKPYRFCAPRGRNDDSTPDDSTPAVDTPGFPVTKYAYTERNNQTDSTPAKQTPANIASIEAKDSHVTPTATPDVQTAMQALLGALSAQAKPVDALALREMVDEAVDIKLAETVKVRLVVESAPDRKVEIDAPHPYLGRIISLVNAGIPVYLWGPAGSGKTTAAMQASKALGRGSEIDTLDPSTFRSMVQGYMTPTGDPVHTSFTRCWTGGLVYIGDECDNAPGHVQTLFNSALANGHAPLAWGNAERGTEFGFVGTGNTPGRPTREFPDRRPMSAAFADRLYFVHWPLDEQSERTWSGVGGRGKSIAQPKSREIDAQSWVDFVQSLRAWAVTHAPTLMITPRASLVGLRALKLGESPEMVADALIFRGADNELRNKALAAVSLP